MWETLEPFFEWSGNLRIGKAIAATIWAFPVIETIHILALTVAFGSLIIIDLRLMGFGMRRQTTPALAKSLSPYVTWGVITMLVTGFMLFSSEAMKCFANEGFRFKMEVLFPALIFHFTLFRWVIMQEDSKRPRILGWFVSLLSLAMWFGVGVGGRAIGFV